MQKKNMLNNDIMYAHGDSFPMYFCGEANMDIRQNPINGRIEIWDD